MNFPVSVWSVVLNVEVKLAHTKNMKASKTYMVLFFLRVSRMVNYVLLNHVLCLMSHDVE